MSGILSVPTAPALARLRDVNDAAKADQFVLAWDSATSKHIYVDVATTADVNTLLDGRSFKPSVRVATTAAGTLATSFENGDTIDGVVLATGDRILIKDQAVATENGIYTVAASGAPTRATDLDTGDSAANSFVSVEEGTANESTAWICPENVGSDVVGTDTLTFTNYAGIHVHAAGDITTGTFADALVAESNITQHEAAINIAATQVTSGTLTHERGGLEVDISAIAIGDVIAGTGTGTLAIVAASGASDGDVLTVQADGTVAFETGGGGDTLPVVDTTGLAKGSVDATKIVRLEVDSLTTATTRVLTVQDADGTLELTGHVHAAGDITSGTLAHERGGLEFDVSAVAIGDVIAGTGTGTLAIVAASGASDGDVLTIQADGTVAFETAAGGGGGGLTVTKKVANYTAAAGDLVVCDATSGAFTITMPAAPTLDDVIGVYLEHGNFTLSVVVQGNGKTLGEFGSSITMRGPGELFVFQYEAAKWVLSGQSGAPFVDGRDHFFGSSDPTKVVRISATGVTTGTTRTLTAPDADGTIALTGGNVATGVWDFGGATSLEIPNGAAPTVNAAGEIAIDTAITAHVGLIKYHDGVEELTVLALPTANLTTTDQEVLGYNATTDELEFINVVLPYAESTLGGAASGDVLYHDGTQWTNLAKGTDDEVLTLSSGLPSWGSGTGATWTARSAAEANQWRGVTYGNGLFVAVSYDGTNRVQTSTDGINWTARSAAEANQWTGITYGNGLFVAVSNSGTNRVQTSPDGITWTARSAAEANQWYGVTYGNGLFVAVSISGTNRVQTSPDGITWTARSAAEANQWYDVTYAVGLFVAVSATGTNRVQTSPDGITWTARSAAANQWQEITYGSALFVAVSYDGAVQTSPDGITWTARSAAEANQWYGVTYGNGLFVAVSISGTNRVQTSGKQQDRILI
tara:strand:+ start:3341 stop:6115 length:2775 start_codon:yes stop_codon:yes gene_type:complete